MKLFVFFTFLSLSFASICFSGPVNGNSPYYCSEVNRMILQEKDYSVPNKIDPTANPPIELKVQLVKSVISCAGPYSKGDVKVALSVELMAKDSTLLNNNSLDFISPDAHWKKMVNVNFDPSVKEVFKDLKLNYFGQEFSIEENFQIEDLMFRLPIGNQFYSSYSTKVMRIEISNAVNGNDLSKYWKEIKISVKNLPEFLFTNN